MSRSILINRARIFGYFFILIMFLAAIAIMLIERNQTVRSCLSDAAKIEARRQFNSGQISEGQLIAALTCDIHAAGKESGISTKDIDSSVTQLFGKVTTATLYGLLEASSRSASALLLASNPRLESAADFKAAGLLLFGVDTQGSIRAYQRALAISPNDMDSLIRLGQLYHRESQYAKSESFYNKVIATDDKYSKWRSSAIMDIGTDYDDQGDFPKASSSYRQAADLCSRIGRPLCAARAMANLGELDEEEYKSTNNHLYLTESRALTLKSLDIFKSNNQAGDAANNLQALALIDDLDHALPLARREAEESLNAFLQLGDAEGAVLGRGVLGDIALEQNDLTAAQASYQALGREAAQHGMRNEVVASVFDFGLIAAARHHHEQACQFYAKAFAAWAAAGIDSVQRQSAGAIARQEHCANS